MAYSADDSMSVLVNLTPGMRRGGSCAFPGMASRVVALESLFDRHPYTNSRVWLTGDRKLHSGRRGGVPSTSIPAVLGMTLRCPGWWYSGEDGRTGPEVTEKTRSVGLTSRHHPGREWSWWSYPFRGCRRPLRSATWRRYESGRHSVTE
jgi:hypothetical protein